MTARFVPTLFPGGRIVLRQGGVDVGAVFPPCGNNQHRHPWVWRLWVSGKTTTLEGRAKTEDAARAAILAAWHDTLAAMALQSIPDPNAKGQSDD